VRDCERELMSLSTKLRSRQWHGVGEGGSQSRNQSFEPDRGCTLDEVENKVALGDQI
jgi:hypothetical protein